MIAIAVICGDSERTDAFIRQHNIGIVPFCDPCQFAMKERSDKPGLFRCNRCRKNKSIFKGTVFENCKAGRGNFLLSMWLFIEELTVKQIARLTLVDRQTIGPWLQIFREAILWDLQRDHNAQVIGGEDVIVEIDESKFGKRKYNRGKRVEGCWVVGGVERGGQRRMFAVVVKNRSAKTLMTIIEKYVAPGSQVYTDCWKGYRTEGLLDQGLLHGTVNHSLHFVDPVTLVHTNSIEGTWSGMKRKIASRYYQEDEIELHLAEYIWRRLHAEKPWEDLLSAIREYWSAE